MNSPNVYKKPLFNLSLLCLIILLILSAITGASFYLYKSHKKEAQALENNILSQQNMNADAKYSAEQLERYSSQFKAFKDHGIIGQPDRLHWIETVVNTARVLGDNKLSFTLSPSKLLDSTHPYYQEGMMIEQSPMVIKMDAFDEGTVYQFYQVLTYLARGLFIIDECDLQYKLDDNRATADTDNEQFKFFSRCDINWYTIKNSLNSDPIETAQQTFDEVPQ